MAQKAHWKQMSKSNLDTFFTVLRGVPLRFCQLQKCSKLKFAKKCHYPDVLNHLRQSLAKIMSWNWFSKQL